MKRAGSLLICQPGPLRDGLGFLLTSILQTSEINSVDDTSSALCRGDEISPCLVLLVADVSSGGLDSALEQLRGKWPLARLIVMADDEHTLHIAQSAGADQALLKGCRANKLVEAIEQVKR